MRESLHALSVECQDGTQQINQYHLLKMIGSGAFGTVHLGEFSEDGQRHFVAIKSIDKRRLRRQRLQSMHRPVYELRELDEKDPLFLVRTEVAIMKKLRHPHVVRLYEALDDPEKDSLYLVFDYCAHGPIYTPVPDETRPPLPEARARSYFRQLLRGLDYLHRNGVVHRDIKPDNILRTGSGEECKIVDFGVSAMFFRDEENRLEASVGTPTFMSPQLAGAELDSHHAQCDDLWASGVTLYCMLMGHLPFYQPNLADLYHDIIHKTPSLGPHLSDSARDLLERMLAKRESDRLSMAALFEHPWITEHGTHPLVPTQDRDDVCAAESVTDEDVQCAVCRIASLFTVAHAVSKFRRRAGSRPHSARSHTDTSDGAHSTECSTPPRTPALGTALTRSRPVPMSPATDGPRAAAADASHSYAKTTLPELEALQLATAQADEAAQVVICASPTEEAPVFCESP